MEDIVQFDFPTDSPKIIKVIGVGGGGGNAANHMYREGIHDVTFVLCNTDNQALKDSPVPVKLQLGKEGLGAGNRPARARKAAEESIEDIKNMLNDGTKMVFITAGMGGGTGTGAAPIIAQTSLEPQHLDLPQGVCREAPRGRAPQVPQRRVHPDRHPEVRCHQVLGHGCR